MMEKASNKRIKKATITQEFLYSTLQRYSAATVLTLLKEVAQAAGVKIDWNELVKKTATGISSAREYQMLWRHLAYHDILQENLDQNVVPMDDDSDLEFELEAHPPVSADASTEAAACVKVIIASASLVDANLSSVVEAPLSLDILSGWSSTPASKNPQLQETKITVPVLVSRQPRPLHAVASTEALDENELASGSQQQAKKKRRRPWSKKEDAELVAAVQRNGEGNWNNILKGEFKSDRTASQLAQRWGVIKKRKEYSSVGVRPQLADFHAVRRAFHLALDMPIGDNSKSSFLNGKGGTNANTITTPSNSLRPIAGEPLQPGTQSQRHQWQDSDPMSSSKPRSMNTMKTSTSPAFSADAMVKATAVAAGARIATPSDAATLLKAAQSKNSVHFMPSGPNSIKSSGLSNANALPPNVHFIQTGLVNRSKFGHNPVISSASRPGGTHKAQSQNNIPSLSTTQTYSPQPTNESKSPQKKVYEDIIVLLGDGPTEQAKRIVARVSCNGARYKISERPMHNEAYERVQEGRIVLPGSETHVESENNNVQDLTPLLLSKVDKMTDLTGLEAKYGSENEENNMIEVPADEKRERGSTAEDNKGEREDGYRMIEMPDAGERENGPITEKSASEMEEEIKIIEMPIDVERENKSMLGGDVGNFRK